jgi:hypothetical protein
VYHVSSNFHKGFRRSCDNKVFFKEQVKSRTDTPLKITGQCSLCCMHAHLQNVIFPCTTFHQNPTKGLGEVVKTILKGKMDGQTEV